MNLVHFKVIADWVGQNYHVRKERKSYHSKRMKSRTLTEKKNNIIKRSRIDKGEKKDFYQLQIKNPLKTFSFEKKTFFFIAVIITKCHEHHHKVLSIPVCIDWMTFFSDFIFFLFFLFCKKCFFYKKTNLRKIVIH